jgi:photosystem II stability/assembly factor-like uncharacterized protein
MLGLSRSLLNLLLAILVLCVAGSACAAPPPDRPFFVRWKDSGRNTRISGVYFIDAQTGWAVGDSGTILTTHNGGTSWEPQESLAVGGLNSVHFVDPQTGWIVGNGGMILATRNGGASWERQNSGTGLNLWRVHFVDTHIGWAVGNGGTIVATRNGGSHWELQKTPTTEDLNGAYFADVESGWVVGDSGTILTTRNGGSSWELQKSGTGYYLAGVDFADTRTGWAVGEYGTILATRDRGAHWEPQISETRQYLNAVHFADAKSGWAVGDSGTILATRDGGRTWEHQISATSHALNDVRFINPRAGWAVGGGGTILATRDAGKNWEPQRSGTDKAIADVRFIDAQTGWAVGDEGTILATRDGGRSWESQRSGTVQVLTGVHFADAQTGWAVGMSGTILATRNGGKSWEACHSGTDQNLWGVHFVDARHGWTAGWGGTILGTRDGGTTWEPQSSGTDEILTGVYFVDTRTGWVVGKSGTILATHDGGKRWEPQKSGTVNSLLSVQFADARQGWAVGYGGTILLTHDGGIRWEEGKSGTQWDLNRVHFADTHSGWVVGKGGTILATRDGGASWRPQRTGTDRELRSVHFADARTGWAVGDSGTMLRSGPPIYSPSIEGTQVIAKELGELDVSFRVNPGGGAAITEARLWARVREAQWTPLGAAHRSDTGDGAWHLAWRPETIAHAGDEIEYQAELDDGGPPEAISLGKFTYDPWWAQIWRENSSAITTGLAALAILLVYAGYFALVLLWAPARLASVGMAPELEGVAMPSGNLGFFWDLARKGFERVTLPWLRRHPRVRRAWTALYRDGRAKLDDLSKVARSSFVAEPEVLDAWVARSALKVERALDQLDLFKQRQIYVAFPIQIGRGGPVIERPNVDAFRPVCAGDRAIVSIVGSGGTGKSTLACALARWAFAADPTERLRPHRMVPVFIVQETTNLSDAVIEELRRMLGDEELPSDLVRALMAKQRLLVIVDALSEREPATQRHVEQVFAQDVPLNAVVITSRAEPNLGAIDRTKIYPMRLDAASIVPFIIGYLDRMKAGSQLKDGRAQLQLGERILTLAESGGRKTPVTPLLVTLFVDSALRRAEHHLSFDDMPDVVPEVFVDYLRRLNANEPKPDGSITDELFIRAAQTVATVSLGKNLVPQDFSTRDAVEALKQDDTRNQDATILDRLVASGVIERRTPGGYVVLRFSLDPAAEYLAAIRRLFIMKTASCEEWQSYLSSLKDIVDYPEGPEGYLTALATCYKVYKTEFSLPEALFPWDQAPEISAANTTVVDASTPETVSTSAL